MSFKKSFFITKYFLICLVLASCAGTPPKSTSSNYFESEEYFNHLYATQNYTPIQERLVRTGQKQIGVPYVYGGTSPTKGFDCSGFTQYVYKHAIDVNLPRRAYDQQEMGQFIPKEYMLPGDLVFLDLVGPKSHVGIYIGEGKFFHASTSRKRLMVADLHSPYFSNYYNSSIRLLKQ